MSSVSAAEIRAMDEKNRKLLTEEAFDQSFLVSAGAGAGKSHTIVQRIIHLLCDSDRGIGPENVVAITFTDKATTELREKMLRLLGNEIKNEKEEQRLKRLQHLHRHLPQMQISTIHSFCKRILQAWPLESGVGFAPVWETAESPLSADMQFFDRMWKQKQLPLAKRAGLGKTTTAELFRRVLSNGEREICYVDPASDAFEERMARIRQTTDRLLGFLPERLHGYDFNRMLAPAIRKRNAAEDMDRLTFILTFGSKAEKAAEWRGKNARKTASGAAKDLGAFVQINEESMLALERCFAVAAGKKGDERIRAIDREAEAFPPALRAICVMLDQLSDLVALKEIAALAGTLLHGMVIREMLSVCEAYRALQDREHIISFDDMLRLSVNMVRTHPQVREKLHEQYRVFFIDEYQDTDPVQTELVFSIAAEQYDPKWQKCIPAPGSLFFVGDPKQAIYRFRGADISMWQEAENVMQACGGKVVHLYRNFRSTQLICEAATSCFGEGAPLEEIRMQASRYQAQYTPMFSTKEERDSAVYEIQLYGDSPQAAVEQAAVQAADMIAGMVESGRYKYGDFLLISRNREKNQVYSEEMRRRGIPLRFDGSLAAAEFSALKRMDLRLQAVVHRMDNAAAFAMLEGCFGVTCMEWMRFVERVKTECERKDIWIRSLARDIRTLREQLPVRGDEHVFRALECFRRDITNMESSTPVAFLEKMLEDPYTLYEAGVVEPDAIRLEYAAALRFVRDVASAEPLTLTDAATLLRDKLNATVDRMPVIENDENVVRLMNAHKVKGLQGNVVMLLPAEKKRSPGGPQMHISRSGEKATMYVKAGSLEPPDWQTAKAQETAFLEAEDVRLRYVALTRAEKLLYVFTYIDEKGKDNSVWRGLGVGANGAGEVPFCAGVKKEMQVRERFEPEREIINRASFVRCSPSELQTRVDDPAVPEAPQTEKMPRGRRWGNIIHRTCELFVAGEASLSDAAFRAVVQEYEAEDIRDEEKYLCIPEQIVQLKEKQHYVAGKAAAALHFLLEDDVELVRRLRSAAAAYTEMPFCVSVDGSQPELYALLGRLTETQGKERYELSGIMDLCLQEQSGEYVIIDYKTDLCPGLGERDADALLRARYHDQLQIYAAVLEHMTKKRCREVYICSVSGGGRLIPVPTENQ